MLVRVPQSYEQPKNRMPNVYVLSMQKPHQAMGLPVSMPKRLHAMSKRMWVGLGIFLVALSAGNYVYQVNRAATKGFALRTLEKQVDQLDEMVTALENKAVALQSMSALEERVRQLGYIPITKFEYLNNQKDMALR